MFQLDNTPVKKSVVLNFGFFVCALQGQNPVVIRDPNLLADERIWSLLVGERVGFCVGDSVYREKLKEVRDGVIYFQAMPFSYMPKVSLPLSKTDSVLVWLPLHEGGACLLVPVACVGGGMASAIPVSIILWEYLNRPDYPDYDRANDLNRLLTFTITLSLTAVGVYYSWQYLRHSGESEYKTELFLKRIEGAK